MITPSAASPSSSSGALPLPLPLHSPSPDHDGHIQVIFGQPSTRQHMNERPQAPLVAPLFGPIVCRFADGDIAMLLVVFSMQGPCFLARRLNS